MEREQILAFRLARHGLDARRSMRLAEAAACPISDYARGSAAVALAARTDGVTREAYDRAIDSGELVVGPSLRAAIHALAPGDLPLYGPALRRRLLREGHIAPGDALREVAEAIEGSLAGGRALTKDDLHAELRRRVRGELMPWCRGCGSYHVAPMLWRFAGAKVGMRCDSRRRFRLGEMGPSAVAAEAARRFLRFYGPATSKEFSAWAGLATAHARRLWAEIQEELLEVRSDNRRTWLLLEDETALDSPPSADGVRLLPPRDPYLQQYDRATLAPDTDLRKRLFRPAASPGAVLQDGRLAGLWRARSRGSRTELEVEELEPVDRDELQQEASLVAEARGSPPAAVRWP